MLQNPALVPWPGSCCCKPPGPDIEFWDSVPDTGTPKTQEEK